MEQLNSVCLRGRLGNVRTSTAGGVQTARATIATNSCYRDCSNQMIIETTWTNLVIPGKSTTVDLEILHKGDAVEVNGRLRNSRYTGPDGIERTVTEVFVTSLSVLDVENQ